MEEDDLHHANKLKRLSHEESLRQAQSTRAAKLEARRAAGEMEIQHLTARNQERLGFLRDPAACLLGVDQPLHVLEDRGDAGLVGRETLLHFQQRGAPVFGMDAAFVSCNGVLYWASR